MADIVFVLGAGASRDAGGPLMSDFLETAENWSQAHHGELATELKRDLETVQDAINGLQAVFAKSTLKLDNIESIFGAFEMARLIGRFPGRTEDEITRIAEASRRLIVRTLEGSIRFRLNEGHLQPTATYHAFSKLIKRLGDGDHPVKCAIITLNYDMALDYALHYESLEPEYCLDSSPSPGMRCQSVPLLKLHGSINWGHCQECRRVVPLALSEYFRNRRFLPETLDIPLLLSPHVQALRCCNGEIGGLPVIVPPTWNKTEYQDSLRNVWRRAAGELADAERVIVCGYSLPEGDIFFRYFYALGSVGRRRLKEFSVYDPDKSGNVATRFRELVGGAAQDVFRHVAVPFATAVGQISKELAPENRAPRPALV